MSKRDDKHSKDQSKVEEMLKELIMVQTEAAKRAEKREREEKKKLFQCLRESDNRNQEVALGAGQELGTILKK